MSSQPIAVVQPKGGFLLSGVVDLTWRSLLVGAGYLLTMILAGMVVGLLGLPLPDIASRVDPQASLLSGFIGGVLLSLFLGPLSRRLEVSTVQRAAVLFLLVLVVNKLVNLIEGVYFTTFFGNGVASTAISMTLCSAGLALLVALLFRPRGPSRRLGAEFRSMLAARTPASWTWRIGLAGLLYLPTYFFFGMLVYPFVRAFYEDPAMAAGVRVPGFEVIIPLEVVRGLLYVLALLPIIALLRIPRWQLALGLGLLIAALNGWEPLSSNGLWPVTMRVAHGLEITGDALVQGIAIAWLLGVPGGRPGTTRQHAPGSWESS